AAVAADIEAGPALHGVGHRAARVAEEQVLAATAGQVDDGVGQRTVLMLKYPETIGALSAVDVEHDEPTARPGRDADVGRRPPTTSRISCGCRSPRGPASRGGAGACPRSSRTGPRSYTARS